MKKLAVVTDAVGGGRSVGACPGVCTRAEQRWIRHTLFTSSIAAGRGMGLGGFGGAFGQGRVAAAACEGNGVAIPAQESRSSAAMILGLVSSKLYLFLPSLSPSFAI